MENNSLLRSMMSQFFGVDTSSGSQVTGIGDTGAGNEELQELHEAQESQAEERKEHEGQKWGTSLPTRSKCGCSRHHLSEENSKPTSRCSVAYMSTFTPRRCTGIQGSKSPYGSSSRTSSPSSYSSWSEGSQQFSTGGQSTALIEAPTPSYYIIHLPSGSNTSNFQ